MGCPCPSLSRRCLTLLHFVQNCQIKLERIYGHPANLSAITLSILAKLLAISIDLSAILPICCQSICQQFLLIICQFTGSIDSIFRFSCQKTNLSTFLNYWCQGRRMGKVVSVIAVFSLLNRSYVFFYKREINFLFFEQLCI